MSVPTITDVLLHVDEQQELLDTETVFFAHIFSFFYSCILSFSLSNASSHWLHGEEWNSTERRPQSNIFIYVVLTWLNSPFKRLMRTNGLVEEPTACIHSCHHHLNPGLLNLQLWPPTWMGNDLSVLDWHPLCQQWSHSSSVDSTKTAQPSSSLSAWFDWSFVMWRPTWALPLACDFIFHWEEKIIMQDLHKANKYSRSLNNDSLLTYKHRHILCLWKDHDVILNKHFLTVEEASL